MLNNSVIDELEDVLFTYEEAFSIDELCGFLYGIAITAEPISPSEWLPVVFSGVIPEFESQDEARLVMDLLMQAYNQYITDFQEGTLAFPYDYEDFDPEDFEMVEEWCMGLSQGMGLRSDFWLPSENPEDMDEDEEEVASCVSIVEACADLENIHEVIDHTRSSDPKIREEGHDIDEVRVKLLGFLPKAVEALTLIGAKKAAESPNMATPVQPLRPKVGRNQLCPCGSGKKFKKCCGGSTTSIH